MKPVQDLIFDVGVNKGEDTGYYLARGFRVVAIDADPRMIEIVKAAFPKEVQSGRLSPLNFAVSDKDSEEVSFYLSEDPHYNSLTRSLTDYGSSRHKGTIKAKTRTLPSLFKEYGLPYYCKIDVQGQDAVLLETMTQLERLPVFISVESEVPADSETPSEEALGTLEGLNDLGYRKFKLVEQATLIVLGSHTKFYSLYPSSSQPGDLWLRRMHTRLKPQTRFYGSSSLGTVSRIRELWRLNLHRRLISFRLRYHFPWSSSGPFGDDLDSEWLRYEEAKETYMYHRKEYFEMVSSGGKFPSDGFWCDWHAKLE